MIPCWRVATAAALCVVGSASALPAQTPRPMTLIDLMEVPRVVDPQLSPSGRSLLFQMSRADWKADRRVPHIWRQDLGGGPPIQMTSADGGETTPRWSPDGKTILFLRGGQIWLLPADGGESRQLTRHPTTVASPSWTPDGSSIYFLAADAKTAEERERDRIKDDVYAYEDTYKHRHLWKVIVSTGAEQAITSGEASVLEYRLSADGKRIALERAPSPLAKDGYRGEIWVMDANGEHPLALTHNAVNESAVQLSPDNSQVLFIADANPQLEPYYNSNLFVMPAGGGTPRALAPDFPYEVLHAAWTPDGQAVVAAANMGVHAEIVRVELNGRWKALTDGRHSIPGTPAPVWSLQPATGTIVFQYDEPARFGDVWTLPVSGGTATRVTGVYDFLQRDFRLPRQERVEWKSPDGTTIEGLLFYPLDYAAGTRYPLVVQMHGGPMESDRFSFGALAVWDNYTPVLTAKGYAVLKPNYRGSTGYGNAFYRDIIGNYFKNQPLDVLAGVDALIARGLADPDRLVAMGWSAGGHLTNKLVTMTDRFKAASSGAGAANWLSMYAQTDTRASRTIWFGGTPWQKNAPFDAYWDNSPIKNVANAKTPTLFFVGEDDRRVPLAQSIEMYEALKANGVPTNLWVAPSPEQHQWAGLHHQLFKMNAELEWFEKYASGRPYTREKAPDPDKDKPKS